MSLILGGEGSGNGFHSHGPALNVLLGGEKLWAVRRPATSASRWAASRWAEVDSVDGMISMDRGRDGEWAAWWPHHVWRCSQAVGDLVWLPDGLEHATANRGALVMALTTLSNGRGGLALHEAAWQGHSQEVRALVAAGTSTAATNVDGVSALQLAAGQGYAEAARVLLRAGAAVRAKDRTGATALYRACWGGHLDVVRLLLEAGASLTAEDGSKGVTALHGAALRGHTEVVHTLLQAGAAVDARDMMGNTPLYYASREGRAEAVRVLLAAGATTATDRN